jgi:hypothetical protein
MCPVRVAKLLERFANGFAELEALLERSALKEVSKSVYLEKVRDRIKRLRITHAAQPSSCPEPGESRSGVGAQGRKV